MATRHRPHRGKDGPEIEIGDPFGQYEKQGGAFDGASESGDQQAREFGVPQADIPGGLNHLVNREAVSKKPAHKGAQPADYHKYHGVPPIDEGLYTFPAKADEVGPLPKPAPEPKMSEAVPVYQVEHPDGVRVRREAMMDSITVAGSGAGEPTRLCNYDPRRVEIRLLNEDATNNARFSSVRADLAEGKGSMLPAVTNTYLTLPTQGELFAQSLAAATVKVSVIIVTEVPDRP